MVEGTSIRSHINEFITLIINLNIIETKLVGVDQAIMLLCSLSPSYKTLWETMIYGRKSLTFNDVKDNLLGKEKLHNNFRSAKRSEAQAWSLVGERTTKLGN